MADLTVQRLDPYTFGHWDAAWIEAVPFGEDRMLVDASSLVSVKVGPQHVSGRRYISDHGLTDFTPARSRIDADTVLISMGYNTQGATPAYIRGGLFRADTPETETGIIEGTYGNQIDQALPLILVEAADLPAPWATASDLSFYGYDTDTTWWRRDDEVWGLVTATATITGSQKTQVFLVRLTGLFEATPAPVATVQALGTMDTWLHGAAKPLSSTAFVAHKRAALPGWGAETLRVYDYSGALLHETPALFQRGGEYGGNGVLASHYQPDGTVLYGGSPVHTATQGGLRDSTPFLRKFTWNGTTLTAQPDYSLGSTIDQSTSSYIEGVVEWKPQHYVCLVDLAGGSTSRVLRLLALDPDLTVTHEHTAPTTEAQPTSNTEMEQAYTLYHQGLIAPRVTANGDGFFGWVYGDEFGPAPTWDDIASLWHFSLAGGQDAPDPKGSAVERLPIGSLSATSGLLVTAPEGVHPWNDDSDETWAALDWDYTGDGITALVQRQTALDVTKIEVKFRVRGTASTGWGWRLGPASDPWMFGHDFLVAASNGDDGVVEHTFVFSDETIRNTNRDGALMPRRMNASDTDYEYLVNEYYAVPMAFATMKQWLAGDGLGLVVHTDAPSVEVLSVQINATTVQTAQRDMAHHGDRVLKFVVGPVPDPIPGSTVEYPVTIQMQGPYGQVVGTGSQWMDGSDATYAIAGATATKDRLEVALPPVPGVTSDAEVTLLLRVNGTNANGTSLQYIAELYDRPYDDPDTVYLGAFETASGYISFTEGSTQDLVCTIFHFESTVFYEGLANGAHLVIYGSTAGVVDYQATIYEARIAHNGTPVPPATTAEIAVPAPRAVLVAEGPSTPTEGASDQHHGMFAIPPNRRLSAQYQVACEDQAVWVTPYARLYSWKDGAAVLLDEVAIAPPKLVPAQRAWTPETLQVVAEREEASHWMLALGFTQGDPRHFDRVPPPPGTAIYVECVYVPDNGLDLTEHEQPYLDGDQPGARWEGAERLSTSVWGEEPPTNLTEIILLDDDLLVP